MKQRTTTGSTALGHSVASDPRRQGRSGCTAEGHMVVEVDVSGSLVTSNALALKQGAIAGLGISLQARWMVEEELQAGSLIDLFPMYHVTGSHFRDPAIWLIRAPRAYTPKKVDLVTDFLKSAFRTR